MLICVLGGAILFVLAGSKTSRRGAGKFILLKEIGIKTIIVVITLFALFSVYVIGWFWTVDKTFSEFESPDVNGIIVAEKWEWLAASGHTFYLKSGPFFVKKLSGSIVGKLENREY